MDVHQNAHLTPKGREAMVCAVMDEAMTKAQAARRFKTTAKTVAKWLGRFRAEGIAGLADRSSRPHSSPSQTPWATGEAVEVLRRARCTQDHIAQELGLSRATVSRILKRRGLSLLSALEPNQPRPRYERETPGEIIHMDIKKLGRFNRVGHRITGDRRRQSNQRHNGTAPGWESALEPNQPRPRYERETPGEIIHMDIKKLGRFNRVGHRITGDRRRQSNQRHNGTAPGWEYVHVAIDDHSRIGFADIFPNEKKESAVAFLEAAVTYFATLGVTITRVMTDNGSCYRSKAFRDACRRLTIKHIRTKPYTPQTNGKAERFIQTMLREWAYATEFHNSDQRKADLPKWQHRYNWHRPHASLNRQTPISRLGLNRDNLLKLHS